MILRLSVEFGPREVWRPRFAVETTLLSRGTQIVSIGKFSGCHVKADSALKVAIGYYLRSP